MPPAAMIAWATGAAAAAGTAQSECLGGRPDKNSRAHPDESPARSRDRTLVANAAPGIGCSAVVAMIVAHHGPPAFLAVRRQTMLPQNGSDARELPAGARPISAAALAFVCYAFAIDLIYVAVRTHTPMSLFGAFLHDDALFISQGNRLAQGEWLGPFTQFTLMKGPGYPLFLAVTSQLGLSVSLAHALFHCATIGIFTAVCHRFTRSWLVSAVLLTLLVWNPASLTEFLLRVIREAIYYGQVLLVFATLAYATFSTSRAPYRLVSAAVGGAAFGWYWLTREDGIWMLPAIAVLASAALFRAVREGRLRPLAATLTAFVLAYGVTQAAFYSLNRIKYGMFVGVDVKERNFLRALRAIHAVVSEGTTPLVSVTNRARQRIYRSSPAFASLTESLEGPLGQTYAREGCAALPTSCGEVPAGFFQWELRDAAARAGHYASPAQASAFYGQIADQIEAACARHDLECAPQIIAEIPHVEWSRLSAIPASVVRAFQLVAMIDPPPQVPDSSGTAQWLATALRFLDYPLHTPSADDASANAFVILGWYYGRGSDWLSIAVSEPSGLGAPLAFDRIDSADVAAAFKDPAASQQRFRISAQCGDSCIVEARSDDGKSASMPLRDLMKAPLDIKLGGGTMHIDYAEVRPNPVYAQTRFDRLCERIRHAVLVNYKFAFVPVLILGVAGFFASMIFFFRDALKNTCCILALVAWTMVVGRTGLLVLVDILWFPALSGPYFTTASFLLVCAAVLSIAAFVQLFVRPLDKRLQNAEASSK
jgi:hypothetical protein